MNFFKKFIKRLTFILDPLLKLLRKNAPFIMSLSCIEAFQKIKNTINNKDKLQTYDPEGLLIIYIDASMIAYGANVCQLRKKIKRPVIHWSQRRKHFLHIRSFNFLELHSIINFRENFNLCYWKSR
uniref:RT_RNaseH_2 domain-containing protein n=1 Tax=Strongyloides venezuelensis TaxID=75913 RepID=A0A0K0FAW1_STRVS